MNMIAPRPVSQKTEKAEKDPEYMAKVAQLPCVICFHHGYTQTSRTQVHHCIHGRYSSRKSPDHMTIPLCRDHHQGFEDATKIAIHREPSRWKRFYGEDTDYVSGTLDQIERLYT